MWFKKPYQVPIFFTVFVLFAVSTLLAPVVPNSKTHSPAPADAQSLLAEANRLSWLDNWTAAGPLYDRAEALFRIAGDKRNELFAHLGRIRAFGPAGSWERMSRALHQQLKNPIVKVDPRLRLWCLALQGYVDIDLNVEPAKRSWREVLAIATELGEQRWKARALGELGVIAFFEGNLTRAVRLVGDSVLSLAAAGDNAGVARLLTMAGYGFGPQGRFSEAKWFFIRAQALMQSTPDAGFPFGAKIGYAEALAGEGDRSRARNLLYDVLTEARSEKDSFHEADALIVLGQIASKTRELELATLYFKQAATIAHTLRLYRAFALAMSDLASVYRIQGKFVHADATIQIALKADHHLGDRYYMPRDLTAAAELKIAENQPRQAEFLFEEAEDLTDGVMRYQHADYGNAALSGAMSETYLQHFHLLQQDGGVARAFRLLERVRGRILATRMYGHRKAPTGSRARETIEANIAAIQVKLMANEDPNARLALEDQLFQNERTLAVEDNKSSENWTLLRPASLTSVQKVLRHDELLLEYVLDDPHAFCIAVTSNDARIIQLSAGGGQIQDLAESYLRQLKARSTNQQLASQLYTILLKDAAQAFPRTRLIIAPDGILNFLPFEALRDADGNFVVSSTVISYTPSATALWVLRIAKTPPASRALLAIGDVEYADRRISRDSRSSQQWIPGVFRDLAELSSSHLQNLPESRQEVLSIARIAGADSKVLLGRDATETAFKAQPLSQFRVVHLAVHAIADSQYPDRSALVLAADSLPEDGLLQVREISRLRLNADLVTLSACQTGIGPTEGEAGVISLEQAFLMAGAKAVVASLWNVEDQSTTVLMEGFYRRLAEHEDKAMALAHAKRDFLEQNRNLSAFYWAGFVIVGEGAATVSLGN